MKINGNINPISWENMQVFSENPDKYLLSVQHDEGKGVSINLMKKGIITWIKVNIGGLIGLFDATSVKMQFISSVLLQVESREEDFIRFNQVFLAKKIKFEKKHHPLFNPHKETLKSEKLNFAFKDVAAWKVEGKIKENVNNVCPGLFTAFSVNIQGEECHITLQSNGMMLRNVKNKDDDNEIDNQNVLNSILSGTGDCSKDLKKIMHMGYRKIHINFSIDKDKDEVSAIMFAV